MSGSNPPAGNGLGLPSPHLTSIGSTVDSPFIPVSLLNRQSTIVIHPPAYTAITSADHGGGDRISTEVDDIGSTTMYNQAIPGQNVAIDSASHIEEGFVSLYDSDSTEEVIYRRDQTLTSHLRNEPVSSIGNLTSQLRNPQRSSSQMFEEFVPNTAYQPRKKRFRRFDPTP